MKASFRTSLAVVSIATTMTLLSAFMVAYRGTKMVRGSFLADYPLWPILALAIGVTGILLIISKGKAIPPFVDPKLTGYLALGPLAAIIAITGYFRVGPVLAFFLLAFPCAAYAIWTDEPAPETSRRDLNDFLGIGTLLLFGVLGTLLPDAGPIFPPTLVLAISTAIALPAAYVCWRAPSGRQAGIARIIVGAALVAISILALAADQPVYAILYLPVGLLLVLHPVLGAVHLGTPSESGLTDENIVIDQFEKISELTIWSVYVFLLIHSYYAPSGISNSLFALFVAGFVLITFEYEIFPKKSSTYEFVQEKSMANTLLLSLVAHLTGGFQSPYIWFFVLVLTSGAFVPKPKMILERLYLISGFYVLEALYYAYYGALNGPVVVDYLILQLFVMGLAGVYAYRLALHRKQIDDGLTAMNDGLKRALDGEKAAKAVAERQAIDIGLAKQRNDSLLASLADGVVGFDAAGRIVSINPAAEGLIGISSVEALGKRLRDIIHIRQEDDPDFRLSEYLETALRGNTIPFPDNVYIEKGDGRKMYLTGVVLPILDESKRMIGIVVTLNDITYTREVEQMKTNFLSVAAHQLRTPLSTIRWHLELLNDPLEGKLKKNQKMFVRNAYTSLLKMVGLVNRLLAVTRLESGRVPFKPEPTDLKVMTLDILESLKPKLAMRKLQIRTDLQDMSTVSIDPTLAREVFVNLIENSIRYTPDGGRIEVVSRDQGDRLSWSVSDTGIGIPKAQQENIFEKFFRAGNAVEYNSEGSGLGLYLAKFIVDAWGGQIDFESAEGKGTKFRVTIPKSGMKPRAGRVSLNA